MTDNEWIKQLQQAMEGYQEAAPDDLWQDIEARLPKHRAASWPLSTWRRIAAAAVVVLAIVGGNYLLHQQLGENEVRTETAMSASGESTTYSTGKQEITPNQATASHSPNRQSHTTGGQARAAVMAGNQPVAQDSKRDAQPHEAPAQLPPDAQANDKHESQEQEPAKHEPAVNQSLPLASQEPLLVNANENKPMRTTTRTMRPIQVDLYAYNNMHYQGRSHGSDFTVADQPKDTTRLHQAPRLAGENATAKHYAPYSLGVGVKYPLTQRLALTSGLVYTRVRSDYTSRFSSSEQTLHYLGVPLGVTYTLWQYKRFSVYAIAGMQADFNFKATLKQSNILQPLAIHKDRVQFSALAGPGLQLDLTPGFGIYVEPTARYYFDNGSDVLNYFKDKPLNININAGLRITLK